MPRKHADGLQRVFAVAHIEEVLEVRTEKVHDKDIVQTFGAEKVDLESRGLRNEKATPQRAQHTWGIPGVPASVRYELVNR